MKRVIIMFVLSFLVVSLSSCNMVGTDEVMAKKYCDTFPTDEGCIIDGEPTGVLSDDTNDCNEGYILQGDVCVLEDAEEPETCDPGYTLQNGNCVLEATDDSCDTGLIEYNELCVETCDLPTDHVDYFPCFRECNVEFPCTHHKLVLVTENSYFGTFVMYVQDTDMNNSAEFVLHHTLSDSSDVIVSSGIINLWCSPNLEGCENMYKANFMLTQTTGDYDYTFQFWYDENWYVKVQSIQYEVWNANTNDYDTIDVDVGIFYLEDILEVD